MNQDVPISEIQISSMEKRVFYAKDCYHVFLIREGSCHVSWGQTQRECGQEHFILMQPNQQLSLQRNSKHPPALLWQLQLAPTLLQTLSAQETDLLNSFGFLPFGCAAIAADYATILLLKNLVGRLQTESKKIQFGRDVLMGGLVSILLVLILRICISADFTTQTRAKHHPFAVDHLFVYIREHLQEKVTLKTLAEHFFVSHEHIAREFKKQTGQTVHQYILTLRLEQACQFLKAGLPVVQVWQLCGFGSYSYFFQAFKRRYGVTPKAFFADVSQ